MWLLFPLLLACSSTAEPETREAFREVEPSKKKKRTPKKKKPSKDMEIAERDALEALGYVAGEEVAMGDGGVSLHDAERAQQGTNLITSAHALEILLTDMEGEVLHRWTLDPEEHGVDPRRAYFRRAWLLEDGAVLAIIEYDSMWKIAADGTVLWHVRNHNHHDAWLADDGSIYGMVRRTGKASWWGRSKKPLHEEAIAHYSADGEELSVVSVHHALERSSFEALYKRASQESGDALHLNSIAVLDGSAVDLDPAFAEGNYLVSSRRMSHLMVVDPEKKEVVWIHEGSFQRQHEATPQPGGRILLFDNASTDPSGALELQLPGMEPVWSYYGKGKRELQSKCCGTAQRLDNGNTLLVATTDGVAVEVTSQGRRVWEFETPYRTEENHRIRANLFDVVRYGTADGFDWL